MGIAILPLCVYPDDYPSTKLNNLLRDTEYLRFNKEEMYITKEALEGISGKDASGWTDSANPLIEKEYVTELYGSKAEYIVR